MSGGSPLLVAASPATSLDGFDATRQGDYSGALKYWQERARTGDAQAQFADATPGPSVFSDGQEYPGNENAVRVLGDSDGDGVVRIENLFGDETSFKKFTDSPPFSWIVGDVSWVK